MAEGTEPIRQDIDAIRDSMTEKMEQIETRVKDTVDNTVGSVKRTVDTTVDSVKRSFDLQQQVNERPWVALGVAVLAGYVIGSLGGGSSERYTPRGEPMRYYPAEPRAGEAMRYYPSGTQPTSSSYAQSYESRQYNGQQGGRMGNQSGFMGEVMQQFGGELNMLASAAMTAGMAMIRDTISQSLPQFSQEYDRVKRERDGDMSTNDYTSPSDYSSSADDMSGLRSQSVGMGGSTSASSSSISSEPPPVRPTNSFS